MWQVGNIIQTSIVDSGAPLIKGLAARWARSFMKSCSAGFAKRTTLRMPGPRARDDAASQTAAVFL